MKQIPSYLIKIIVISIICILSYARPSLAFWMWTPETNKWVNPKYSVKDTPSEQLKYGKEFFEAGEYKEAIREFQKLIKHYPRAREAPDAQFHIALAWEKQDKPVQAFRDYQLVIDKYPFSERSAQIVQKQYDLGVKLLEGKEDRSKFVDVLSGADYNIIEIFQAVIKNAPYGELAAPSQYKIGLYLMENKLYNEARDEFDKVVNDYPDSEWAKAAKYQIALTDAKRSTNAQYDQRVTQAAVEEFKEFVKVYPDAELTQEAKEQINQLRDKKAQSAFVVAEFYEKQKNFKAAKIYYQSVVEEFKGSGWASKALKKVQELTEKGE